jgi:hypothetical protein
MTSMDPARQAWFDSARAHAVEGILAKYGFKLPLGTKNERKGPCPRCGGDDRFGLNITKQTFTCHQCDLRGAGGIDILVGIGQAKTPWEAAQILEGPPPNGHDTSKGKSRHVAHWTYWNADGGPYLKVDRYDNPDGSKSYPQSRWEDGKWVSGKPKGPKIPYRLPELLDSDRTEPVWITEGEKCADAVASLGAMATSASEGACKWTLDLNEWFRDRIAYILPDNDPQGAKHAQQVAQNLAGVAREVRIITLPDLTHREDVADWIKRGGTREQLEELGDAAPKWQAGGIGQDAAGTMREGLGGAEPEPVQPLETFSAADFEGVDPPPRRWLVKDRIPMQAVTLLAGDGAAGKTTIALQLCVAVPGNLSGWLNGFVEEHGPALFFTAEEDKDEVHRRLGAIVKHHGIAYPPDLHIYCATELNPQLAEPNGRFGKLEITRLYTALRLRLETLRPKLVRQFIAYLRKLARDFDCAVILLSHPSIRGMNDGTGTSGNTAWNNSVRARMYFMTVEDNPTLRNLEIKKNNYGPAGEVITVVWRDGVYIPEPKPGSFDQLRSDAEAEDVFLKCLDTLAAQGRSRWAKVWDKLRPRYLR